MFDPECYELAAYFLSESKDELAKRELAQHIQDAVEDWLNGRVGSFDNELPTAADVRGILKDQ